MATVACAGCGLPRAEAEVGAKPCPVCDAPVPGTGGLRPPLARKNDEPDPTAGLPADVSELNDPGAEWTTRTRQAKPEARSRLLPFGVAFALGILCGVGGLFAVQNIEWPKPDANGPEVAARPDEATAPVSPPAPPAPEVAPMPHEGGIKPIAPAEPDSDNEPDAKPIPQPAVGVVVIHEINQPDAAYSIPALRKGEHIVLKGKVKTLRVRSLDAGAILDASQLAAEVVTVSGKIDNRSKLQLFAPGGSVQLSGKTDNGSKVEIDAPGGNVKFVTTTTPNRDGSKIDNGSTVAVTARTVEFKGEVTGKDTKVSIVLTRNGWLEFAAINGHATVEYKSQVAGWSPPDVKVASIAKTATFRKID